MQEKSSFIENSTLFYFNKRNGGILRRFQDTKLELANIKLIAICRRPVFDSDFDYLFVIDKNLQQYVFDYRSLELQNIQKIFNILNIQKSIELGEEYDFKYVDKIIFPKELSNEKLFSNDNLLFRTIKIFKNIFKIEHLVMGKLDHKVKTYLIND